MHHLTQSKCVCLQIFELCQALRYPERYAMGGPFNLVTITPPYEEVVYADLLKDVLESPVRYMVISCSSCICMHMHTPLPSPPPALCLGHVCCFCFYRGV